MRRPLLGALVAWVLLAGCTQHRTVPVSEVSKFSRDTFPAKGGVVVHDVDGQRVRIEHFRTLEVAGERCVLLADAEHEQDAPCRRNLAVFVAPLGIHAEGTTLFIEPNPSRGRYHQAMRFDGVREITVADKSDKRGAIILFPAVGVAALVFVGAVLIAKQSKDDDNNEGDLATPILSFGAAAAAGGATLLLTIPLTADLGKELDP